jgi:hypothetical protein
MMKTRINPIMGPTVTKAALTAGVGLALMFLSGILADYVIMPEIIDWQDALESAKNISDNITMYRLGILFYTVDMLANIIVAIALFYLLKPVNSTITLIMSLLRGAYVVLRSISLVNLVKVIGIVSTNGSDLIDSSNLIMSLIEADKTGYTYALFIFGFHVLLLGYLIIKSGYLSRIIGILLLIAFIGYMVYCNAFVFCSDFTQIENTLEMVLGIPAVISELSLCIYLIMKYKKIKTY